MLHALFGSRPARRIRSGPVLVSAAAHAALIGVVLFANRGGNSHSHEWHHRTDRVPQIVSLRYLTAIPVDESAQRPAADPDPERATHRRRTVSSEQPSAARIDRLSSLKTSLAAITDHVAEIKPAIDVADLMRKVDAEETQSTAVADSEFTRGRTKLTDAVPSIVPVATDGIYTPDLVDEQVAPRPGNPRPEYPEPMRAAGIEAAVSVLFVVDTTGRVDEPSIKFATHVHQLFMDAIRVSLRKARFFPARFAGAVVPQLVQQEFRFELRQRR